MLLVEGGLVAALDALAGRSAVPVELTVAVEGRLPEQVEIAAYYGVSEALTNTAKHAEASLVQIQVDTLHGEGTDTLRVQVRDDGRGGATLAGGTGLLGLKDRVEALGGRLLLDSPPEAGTILRLDLPLTTTNGDPIR
jgi:signal transduction histidine kinase